MNEAIRHELIQGHKKSVSQAKNKGIKLKPTTLKELANNAVFVDKLVDLIIELREEYHEQ